MKDFTKGSIIRHLIFFSLPLIFTNLAQALYQLVDAFWVGKILGKDALAAVSTGMPIIFFLVAILIGLGISTTVLVGQTYGSKNFEALSKVLVNSFIISIVLAFIISVVGATFSKSLLALVRTPVEIRDQAAVFMRIIFLGIVFTLVFQWINGVFNGVGDSKTPLYILLVTISLNIILAPVFIKGFWIIPGFGIGGSALATVISNLTGAVIAVITAFRHNLFKQVTLKLRLSLNIIKKILTIALPASLQMMVVSFGFIVVVSLVNSFGTNVISAYGIGNRVDQFAFLTVVAITNGITAISAQNIGARNFDRVSKVMKFGMLVAGSAAFFYFAVVNLFPFQIASIFTKDAAVIGNTEAYFRIMSFSYFGYSVLFCFQGVVRGAGDTIAPFIIVFINFILIRAPLCYVLSLHTSLKERGIWLGMLLSVFSGCIIFYYYYKSGKWKDKKHRLKL